MESLDEQLEFYADIVIVYALCVQFMTASSTQTNCVLTTQQESS